MKKCLKKGGIIYLVTPSEKSIDFPSREGTLNYYDDKTHKYKPINLTGLNQNLRKIIFILLSV